MTVTAASFRGAFPAFANMATYTDPQVNFWITFALHFLNADRWADTIDYGVMLFVAHNLSLEFNANQSAKRGQNPGFVTGPVTSGSVDKVSYSRDVTSAMEDKAGHWNLSVYGLRYIRLAKMMGAGPVQVGAPSPNDPAQWYYNGAWPGPYSFGQ
jgi:hypothetical protein